MTYPNALDAIAFVFPGQGSQYPGMARELHRCGSAARRLLADAEQITRLPVTELMNTADATRLADPHVAQVLVFVSSTVQLRQLLDDEVLPVAVAGHSLGEYTALTAAGMLTWPEAMTLVDARGRAMAAAAAERPGAMAVLIGLDELTALRLCESVSTGESLAVVANLNSPRQLVVSGSVGAVDTMVEMAREAGALRAKRLNVGGAYHSPLMRPAMATMSRALADVPLRQPQVPIISSATGQIIQDVEAYRAALRGQITSPVRWRAAVETLVRTGASSFVEVGPGRVLTGLGRENIRTALHLSGPEVLLRMAQRSAGTLAERPADPAELSPNAPVHHVPAVG